MIQRAHQVFTQRAYFKSHNHTIRRRQRHGQLNDSDVFNHEEGRKRRYDFSSNAPVTNATNVSAIYVSAKFIVNKRASVCAEGENFERVNTFKYLGATLIENGDFGAEMTHNIIQSRWKNWKRIYGILRDRRISLRVKGKVHTTVVRPAMMYSAET